MIQAFDDIKKAPFKFTGNITQTTSSLNLLDLPHWIEHPNTNNTLMDIVHKEWLSNNDYLLKGSRYHNQYEIENELIAPCRHPSRLGHQVIADTLLPYVIQELDRYYNVFN
jgi:hypothetical protein